MTLLFKIKIILVHAYLYRTKPLISTTPLSYVLNGNQVTALRYFKWTLTYDTNMQEEWKLKMLCYGNHVHVINSLIIYLYIKM